MRTYEIQQQQKNFNLIIRRKSIVSKAPKRDYIVYIKSEHIHQTIVTNNKKNPMKTRGND